MQTEVRRIDQRVTEMRQAFTRRDRDMDRIYRVRCGEIHHLFPDAFSEDLPRSVVANHCDVVARDLAEVMAPLPTLDCASGNGITNKDKQQAQRKNRIGQRYWLDSKLQRGMFNYADHFISYGVAILVIEPDFDCCGPVIRIEDPRGFYYRTDRYGSLTECAKHWQVTIGEMCAKYPEYEAAIRGTDQDRRADHEIIDVIRYTDKKATTVYLPHTALIVATAPVITEKIPITIVERPGIGDIPRGQFDDVLWVQLARAIMAQYQLNAADKSINAPIVMPRDVTTFAIGGDATIATDNPQGVKRVALDMPRDIFQMGQVLDTEIKEGARYPQARMGDQQGSIITGRGVEALLGTFDTQLKSAQDLFKIALQDATSLCFELDVKLFGNKRKTITGLLTGRPFELTYVPSRDIGDNYRCEVTYGFAAGMSPSQAMVALLQLRGDQLIGRDTARAQMPFTIDSEKEQRDVDKQSLNEAMLQGLMSTVQSIGPMIQQGQSVSTLLLSMAQIIAQREKGIPLHEAVQSAFQPPAPPPGDDQNQQQQQPPQGMPGMPPQGSPGPQGGGDLNSEGLPPGVAAGQQGMAPGGRPAIQSLIAGLRGDGGVRMSAQSMRKQPIGAG